MCINNYRVSELCSAVKAISNEAEEDQVMLTSEGKQMNPAEMIGAYSVGTVSWLFNMKKTKHLTL